MMLYGEDLSGLLVAGALELNQSLDRIDVWIFHILSDPNKQLVSGD